MKVKVLEKVYYGGRIHHKGETINVSPAHAEARWFKILSEPQPESQPVAAKATPAPRRKTTGRTSKKEDV